MIPDEVSDPTIDFIWIKFIGRTKLGYTDKQTMRLRVRDFVRTYQAYKDDFDQEMMMRWTRTTYAKLKEAAEKAEEWF